MKERRANPFGHMPTTPTTVFDWLVVVAIVVSLELACWLTLTWTGVLS